MFTARYFLLLGLVLLVDAASIVPAEDDWEADDIDDAYVVNVDEESLRVRREINDEEKTSDRESNSAEGPGPRSGESGECLCASHHPCQGLSRTACREKMIPPPYNGPPCELRLLFRLPMDVNITARKECFEKWEKPAWIEKGVDFSKSLHKTFIRPHAYRNLMIHKGCDSQCMFLENKLVVENDGAWTISKEAVMDALREEDDPEELTDAFEEQINKCIEEAGELVHQKQSCKSGSDEFLGCLRINLNNACPGAKWKENRSCAEIEDSGTKLRDCRREQIATFMQRFRHGMKGLRTN